MSPWLTPLGLVPIAAMWLLVREYCGLRARFDDLEAMHGFAAEIADEVDLQQMIDRRSWTTARLLHARRAAILVFADGDMVGEGSVRTADRRPPEERGRPDVVDGARRGQSTSAHLRARLHRAVIRVLGDLDRQSTSTVTPRSTSRPFVRRGLVVVGGREGMADAFDDGDAQRLQNIADQLAAGVGRSLLHRRVEHEATHDPLTGLAEPGLRSSSVLHDRRSSHGGSPRPRSSW